MPNKVLNQNNPLIKLPRDILRIIFRFLTLRDAIRLGRSSIILKRLVEDNIEIFSNTILPLEHLNKDRRRSCLYGCERVKKFQNKIAIFRDDTFTIYDEKKHQITNQINWCKFCEDTKIKIDYVSDFSIHANRLFVLRQKRPILIINLDSLKIENHFGPISGSTMSDFPFFNSPYVAYTRCISDDKNILIFREPKEDSELFAVDKIYTASFFNSISFDKSQGFHLILGRAFRPSSYRLNLIGNQLFINAMEATDSLDEMKQIILAVNLLEPAQQKELYCGKIADGFCQIVPVDIKSYAKILVSNSMQGIGRQLVVIKICDIEKHECIEEFELFLNNPSIDSDASDLYFFDKSPVFSAIVKDKLIIVLNISGADQFRMLPSGKRETIKDKSHKILLTVFDFKLRKIESQEEINGYLQDALETEDGIIISTEEGLQKIYSPLFRNSDKIQEATLAKKTNEEEERGRYCSLM